MIRFLHASTPKHFSTRLGMYETFDEYVISINKLVEVINKKPKIQLTIRYRDNVFCDLNSFKSLLNYNKDNIIIKNDNNLLKDLKVSNLLISYSSTVIEKALYYRKPVALYSISERFDYFNKNYSKKDPIFKFSYNNLENDINNFIKIKKNYSFKKFIYVGKEYNFKSFMNYIFSEIDN
tara:strand:- start:1992 stop:2528 length:537 start_codon:yes stop_codon:yes gene_type:complete